MAIENDTAALVIEHTVKKNEEKRYEEWLGQVLAILSRAPGYLGREVFLPAAEGKPYTIIDRFASQNDLQKWLDSNERRTFVESIRDAFETGDQTTIKAGIDVWFMPDNAPRKPASYKQFLLTASVIYPLSLIISRLLEPLFEAAPFLKNPFVAGLIFTLILVGLMSYVIMPFLNHHLRDWLFNSSKDNSARRN